MFASVLLVDDHAAVLEGLRKIVSARYPDARCATAASLAEARDLLGRETPELAVLDLSISGRSSFEAIRIVRAEAPKCRVLVYTMHAESEFGTGAMQAGAHGYLTKDRPLTDLFQAFDRLEAGELYFSADLTRLPAANPAAGDLPALSPRESQTLKMLAGGLAPKEIAGELGVSIKTVSTYRARILEKLSLSTTADLIRYAVTHGLEN